MQPTFKTGLDFSAMDFRSSMAAFVATEVRADGAGAKAAADPINREKRDGFMATKQSLLLSAVTSSAGTGEFNTHFVSMLN